MQIATLVGGVSRPRSTSSSPRPCAAAAAAPRCVKTLSLSHTLSREHSHQGVARSQVGATPLERALKSLPPALATAPCEVLIGVDAPDDGAVVAYKDTQLVHTVDFFRSFVSDPFVFGKIAANHALSDCDAMGASKALCQVSRCILRESGFNRCRGRGHYRALSNESQRSS